MASQARYDFIGSQRLKKGEKADEIGHIQAFLDRFGYMRPASERAV
jgi:hypothetical protein